jgi:hypothetical protein
LIVTVAARLGPREAPPVTDLISTWRKKMSEKVEGKSNQEGEKKKIIDEAEGEEEHTRKTSTSSGRSSSRIVTSTNLVELSP